jgi:hypothetical protein
VGIKWTVADTEKVPEDMFPHASAIDFWMFSTRVHFSRRLRECFQRSQDVLAAQKAVFTNLSVVLTIHFEVQLDVDCLLIFSH